MILKATPSLLAAWENFYVIVGSTAGALTGLQFVVITLIAEARTRSTTREIAAFGTPTIVHFCSALLASAILSAPWSALSGTGLALGACSVAGMVYAAIIVRRAQRQEGYRPVLEDWLWHVGLPFLAYAGLFAAALALRSHAKLALFVAAAATMLLLFIGIHNAWDAVVYIAVERPRAPERPEKR